METWNFNDNQSKMALLIGADPDNYSQSIVDQAIKDKELVANEILKTLRPNKNSIGAEIGAGCGFMSKVFSDHFSKLYCCDISASFLQSAKDHCQELNNIEYVLLDRNPWAFAEEESLDYIILLMFLFIIQFMRSIGSFHKPRGC